MSDRRSTNAKRHQHISLYQLIVLLWCQFVSSALGLSAATSVASCKDATSPHYGVLLDAGSSSTKLKVYQWSSPRSPGRTPNMTLLHIQKGLSRFSPGLTDKSGSDAELTVYLAKVIDAAKYVLKDKTRLSCTPIILMATAGLRYLSEKQTNDLMSRTRAVLSDTSINPFQFESHTGAASVLSGEEEAAYAWVAANYLAGYFDRSGGDRKSVGILEMGGGSTQIAFIPAVDLYSEEYHVNIWRHETSLYAQSYLSFGLNGMKQRVDNSLYSKTARENTVAPNLIGNPCMLEGDTRDSTVEFNSKTISVTMEGTGDPRACKEVLELQLKTVDDCQPKPCRIGSVYQPSLPNITFYATQAFTHGPKKVGVLSKDGRLDFTKLIEEGTKYCKKSLDEVINDTIININKKFASDDLCFGPLYIHTLLTAYGFKDHHNVLVSSSINNQRIDWALGAMLKHQNDLKTGVEVKTNYKTGGGYREQERASKTKSYNSAPSQNKATSLILANILLLIMSYFVHRV